MTADRERHDKRAGESRASFAEPLRFDARRAEDMSFTRPVRMVCLGEELSGFRGWTDVYRNLARILVARGFVKIGNGVRYVERDDEPLDIAPGLGATRAAEKGGLERRDFGVPGYYLALRRSPTWIIGKISDLLRYVGLEPDAYAIEYERLAPGANARARITTAASTMTAPRLSRAAFEKDFLEFEDANGKGLFARGHLNAFYEAAERAREWGGNLYANLTSARPKTALDALDEFARHSQYGALEEAKQAQFYSAFCELKEYWRSKLPSSPSTRDDEPATVDWDDFANQNFKGTAPIRLTLRGRELTGFRDWNSLYLRLVEELVALELLRHKRVKVAKTGVLLLGREGDADKMIDPVRVGKTGFLLATPASASDAIKAISGFRKLCGIKKGELRIEFRRGEETGDSERDSTARTPKVKNTGASELSNREAVAKFCDEKGVFTMDELEKVVHENPAATSTILGWIAEKTVRLSYDKFIVKGTILFDVPATDRFLELFCSGDYVPIRHIIDAQLWRSFPKATTPWNEFLLESYLDGYSEKFSLWSMGRRKKGVVGAMVRKATHLQSYDELLADAIARTHLELNVKNALDYFGDEKLLLRKFYGTIENVLKLAREIRKE